MFPAIYCSDKLESLGIAMWQLPKPRLPSLKQVLVSSVGGGIGVLGIVLAVGLYIVETVIRPNKKHVFFDDYTFSPYEFDLPAEVVTFAPAKGDYLVSGWFVPHENATTTILVCPGYRTHKSDLLGLSARLWRAGHNVLIFDFYGHGELSSTNVTLGYREMNDFDGAIAYVKERAPQTRLGVVAYSMGASVAIMCSARCPDIKAIVADSGFATHWSVIDYNVRRARLWPSTAFVWTADHMMGWLGGYRFSQVNPLREIGSIAPRPILIIHGGKDSLVDPRDATLLYAAANEPKELWTVPNADHCGVYFVDRTAYIEKTLDFFDKALKQAPWPLIEVGDEVGANHAHDVSAA
ncbi:MAG TPA: alpha/beta hydrolase [Ktedonobacteraceae bacterium]|nr:alpha/beta hydrolase [Ktedonobacteraceae bacterium]